MNWQAVSALAAVLCALATALNWLMTMRVSLEIEKLKAHIAESRMKDREEMRDWLNGSFMRSAVVVEKFDSVARRLSELQASGCVKRGECA